MSLLPSVIFKYPYIDARRIVLADSLGHLHRAVHSIIVPHESADESNQDDRRIRRIHSGARIVGNKRGTRTRCLLPARQGTPTEKRKHQARNSSILHKSFIHQVRQMICALSRLRLWRIDHQLLRHHRLIDHPDLQRVITGIRESARSPFSALQFLLTGNVKFEVLTYDWIKIGGRSGDCGNGGIIR